MGTQPHITDKMPSTKHTHAHTLSHAYTLTNMGIHKHAHVRVLTHMLVHSYAHVYNACIYTGSCNTHIYMLMCSHNTLRYTPFQCTYAYIQTDRHMPTHTCTHGHTYTHIHIDRMFIYTYTHAHSRVHMHTHTHTSKHTHSHMYTCMYMHTHSHILTHCTHFPSVPENSKNLSGQE